MNQTLPNKYTTKALIFFFKSFVRISQNIIIHCTFQAKLHGAGEAFKSQDVQARFPYQQIDKKAGRWKCDLKEKTKVKNFGCKRKWRILAVKNNRYRKWRSRIIWVFKPTILEFFGQNFPKKRKLPFESFAFNFGECKRSIWVFKLKRNILKYLDIL